jgi:chemotaxis protein MotB
MAKRRGHSEEHENAERWLLTYADMITLLMAFFIMLYAMSQLDIKKFEAMTGSVQAQLGGSGLLHGAQNAKPAPEIRSGTPGIAPSLGARDTAASGKSLRQELAPIARKAGMKLTGEGDEVTVSVPTAQLRFAAGSADLTQPGREVLKRLATVLAKGRYEVKVGGHTCDLPVKNEHYNSNWELSADRARNVAFYLISLGAMSAKNCTVMGYADTQPLVADDSEAHRARNRRVEIMIRPLADEVAADTEAPAATPAATSAAATSPPGNQAGVDIAPHLSPVSSDTKEAQ